ncbi:hypothetical protein [Methanogenium cariaci]|uniref:hypothetical protein n=1 Tax=Methanogenium cariaci TaxID=2197 RepID=UPI0007817410|nr:hypothetical protein [Methanogenium cariaci]
MHRVSQYIGVGGGCAKETETDSFDNKNTEIIEARNKEILQLKKEVEAQKGLQDAYSKLISEKDQRIDDMKESISRIEAMSITTTDQIASSKDDRIDDLSHMIEHLQAQAAAHSRVLQSSLNPALESENGKTESTPDGDDNDVNMIRKPRWMFWK